MTSGATGQLYGNGYTWPFLERLAGATSTRPARSRSAILKTLLRAARLVRPRSRHEPRRRHRRLRHLLRHRLRRRQRLPDRGPHARRAAWSSIYTPILRTFTVDMSQLSAAGHDALVRSEQRDLRRRSPARRFPNTGTRDFTPPGQQRATATAAGCSSWRRSRPRREPPDVTLTAPADGATVVGHGAGLGHGHRQRRRGRACSSRSTARTSAAEVPSPPYAMPWNTLSVANGPHVVRAIARDLAGNRGVGLGVRDGAQRDPAAADRSPRAGLRLRRERRDDDRRRRRATATPGTLHGATFAAGQERQRARLRRRRATTSRRRTAPRSTSAAPGSTIAFWACIDSTDSGVDYVIVGKPWNAIAMTSPFYQYGVEYSNGGNKTLDFFFGDPSAGLHGPLPDEPDDRRLDARGLHLRRQHGAGLPGRRGAARRPRTPSSLAAARHTACGWGSTAPTSSSSTARSTICGSTAGR